MGLLATDLNRQLKSFKRFYKILKENPTVESTHQLRICVRRIRAILWILENSSKSFDFTRLEKKLKKLGRELGKKRELDVAIRDAAHYKINTKKLMKKQQQQQKALQKELTDKRFKGIVLELTMVLKELNGEEDLDLIPVFEKIKKDAENLAHQKKFANQELHDIRVFAKKTRYALEALKMKTKPLRALQDQLGCGHDLEVLQRLTKQKKSLQREVDVVYRKGKKMIRPTLNYALKQARNMT